MVLLDFQMNEIADIAALETYTYRGIVNILVHTNAQHEEIGIQRSKTLIFLYCSSKSLIYWFQYCC